MARQRESKTMAQLVVRNIETEVKKKLQRRALRHGHSMEEEVRDILRNAVKDEGRRGKRGLGSEIAALFAGIGLDTDIAELRGHSIKPALFD
jgi:antitoxin FitA